MLLLASTASATNYYVRKDGADSCNGTVDAAGSSGNCAKLTIQAAVDLAYAGDTVYIGAGSYTGNPTFESERAGSAGSYITIRAASGATVNVDRTDINHNYIKLQDLVFVGSRGFYEGGINAIASNVWIYGCTIKGRGLYGVGSGYNTLGVKVYGNNNTVESCIFEGSKTVATSFEIALYAVGTTIRITRNIFRNLDSPERAMELYGSGILVDYNEAYDWLATQLGDFAHPDIFQAASDGVNSSAIIEYNYFHDLQGTQLGNHYSVGTHNWTVRNNIFANIGMQWNVYAPGAWRFHNNLFYRVDYINDPVLNFGGDYTGGAQVYNNAFIGCGYGDASNSGWHNGPSGYNFVSKINGAAKTGLDNIASTDINGGTIGMVAPYTNCMTNTCNFQLTSSSSMRDKATTISSFSTDFLGATRPYGVAWDIGPYEYRPGGDSTPPTVSDLAPSGSQTYAAGAQTLSATTSEAATCRYGAILLSDYYSYSSVMSGGGTTSHTADLTGLADGTSHTRYGLCVDASGNISLPFSWTWSYPTPSGAAIPNVKGLRFSGGKLK
jgi:hypothetical protein